MLKLIIKLICVILLEVLCNFVAIYVFSGNGIFGYLQDFVVNVVNDFDYDMYPWGGIIVAIVILFQIGVVKIYRIKPFEKKVYKIIYSVLSGGLALYITMFYVLAWLASESELMHILYPYLA